MKIILLIGIIFLFSCEKETIHCYRCETVANSEIVSVITTCGMNESEIVDFQQGLEGQATALLNVTARTKCTIKN